MFEVTNAVQCNDGYIYIYCRNKASAACASCLVAVYLFWYVFLACVVHANLEDPFQSYFIGTMGKEFI